MGKIKDFVVNLYRKMPVGDYIIFESAPNVSDNTKAVFDEMVKRKLNEKYTFVWLLNSKTSDFEKIKNVKYYFYGGVWDKLRFLYYKERAKMIICCNRFITADRPEQKAFYLSHGTPLKSTRSYYNVPENIDVVVSASESVINLISYELNVPKEKIVSLGFPRNDVLVNSKIDMGDLFQHRYSKIIVWYPTFRQHKSSSYVYKGASLPILHDVNKAIELNKWAVDMNILLVLKPHFAQDIDYIKKLDLSNILFIDDDFFMKKNITSYEFVGSCDALITDYSSIYYDFTLCDKPIALILEDMNEYVDDTGLIDEFDYYTKGAVKIYQLNDLIQFMKDVVNGQDLLKNERTEIKKLVNHSTKGGATQRVTDFIEKNLNHIH